MPEQEGKKEGGGWFLFNWYRKWRAKRVRKAAVYNADFEEFKAAHDRHIASLTLAHEARAGELEKLLEGRITEARGQDVEAKKQSKKVQKLEQKVEEFERGSDRLLGKHIREDSLSGVLQLNERNEIIGANITACNYLGMEMRDIIGLKAVELAPENHYFSTYMAIFDVTSDRFAALERQCEPNTFKMKDAIFTMIAYPTTKGEGANKTYIGAFVMLTPYVPPSKYRAFAKKLTSRWKESISVGEVLTPENVIDCMVPLMNTGRKVVYIDFRSTEKANPNALATLAKCYKALAGKGTKCVFTNVSLDIAQYFAQEHEIEEVRRIDRKRTCLASQREINEYLVQKRMNKIQPKEKLGGNPGLSGIVPATPTP